VFAALKDFSYHFVNMELNSIGLRMTPSPLNDSNPFSVTSTNNSQFDILLSCLESGKAYLDSLLSVPPVQYRHFSFMEWTRLPYVLVIISKLSFPSPEHTATHWDIRLAQDRVRLDLYLEALCYRMQSITTYSGTAQPHPDIFLSLKMILERTRHWYVRKTRSPAGEAEQMEDSPLEVIRDPHEASDDAVASAGQARPHSPAQLSYAPATSIGQAPMPSHVPSASASGFADTAGFLDNLDDAFWTSSFFDPALFPDMGETGGF